KETSVGPTVLEIAQRAKVDIYSPCGGEGLCGRCVVRVDGDFMRLAPPPPHVDPGLGLTLACKSRPTGDVTVTVPPGSRTDAAQILEESREGVVELSPIVKKVYMELPTPTVADNICDLMRISRGLGLGMAELRAPLPVLRGISNTLRNANWKVTGTASLGPRPHRLIRLEPGDTTAKQYGVAIDLGTTTVVGKLIRLMDGSHVTSAARENAQIAFGEDVIARINHANDEEDGLEQLMLAIRGTIGEVIDELVEESGVDRCDIIAASMAGNTVMEHLYLGVSPANIRLEPYIPTFCRLAGLKAMEADMDIFPMTNVLMMPSRAGFVGGDITADVLACGMHKRDEVALMIDVATNGEVVLGNKDWLMACSCSAGPAFEGGEVQHGMRASRGAIERVEIEDGEPRYQIIGATKPTGICGSGLIDLAAELFYHDIIDRAGSIVADGDPRVASFSKLFDDTYGKGYVLADEDESGTGAPVFIMEAEIKNLIRTKAAMYAACSVMVNQAGITFDELDRIYISGGFGRYLDSWKSRLLGLLPDIEEWKYEFIGNGSLEGARLALLSNSARNDTLAIFKNMTYIELSVSAAFMDEFTSAMFIPHTDLERFPSVQEALQNR
ncbi:MAG: ASKHA domain-containing protein, partial [Candidatus Thermoplasmatota archaeon]|nr:ASKHA domain-containing protein [Candidatus Thermoplasmatota archaeon]